MAVDKLVDSTQLDTDLTSVANAIRTKGGTSASLAFPAGFVQAIGDIPSGGGGTDYLEDRLMGTLTEYENDDVTYIYTQSFRDYTPLTSLKCHNVLEIGNAGLYGCTGLTALAFPKLEYSSAIQNCSNLVSLDIGLTKNTSLQSLSGCSKLSIIIIRSTTVRALGSVNNFNNTPFASGKAGGTLYVPNALISAYQSASNWSTILGYANNQIKKIEGTIYETQYADGTPISA